jgi:hypothetical protein
VFDEIFEIPDEIVKPFRRNRKSEERKSGDEHTVRRGELMQYVTPIAEVPERTVEENHRFAKSRIDQGCIVQFHHQSNDVSPA